MIDLCPSTSETSLKDAPPFTIAVAAVWRRECNPRSVIASGGKQISHAVSYVSAPVRRRCSVNGGTPRFEDVRQVSALNVQVCSYLSHKMWDRPRNLHDRALLLVFLRFGLRAQEVFERNS